MLENFNVKRSLKKLKNENRNILLLATVKGILATVLMGLFFYKRVVAIFILIPLGVIVFFREIRIAKRNSRDKLKMEFLDTLLFVSNNLKAGYSIENAFVESIRDIEVLHGDKCKMKKELEKIKAGLLISIPLEEMLYRFSEKNNDPDIKAFVNTFSIGKRNGSSMIEIIDSVTTAIISRVNTQREIKVMLQGRMLEQNIMRVMPFVIVIYVSLCYKGFFDGLFYTTKGIIIMSVCLLLYVCAFFIGDKIIEGIYKYE